MRNQQRHQTAKTSVEVFRLFKLRDLASVVAASDDPVMKEVGRQMYLEANVAVTPYIQSQRPATK